ncbi:MAG: serine hydrolase [Sphingobacteriales bacterium]|nr:serine hydrolase [Sphingobacteriales bacterium]
MATGAYPQTPKTSVGMREELIRKFDIPDAHIALAFKDLRTGETILINEKENYHAASTMKVPVLIELYRQAGEGKISLKDSMLIKNSFSSIADGSEFKLDSTDDSEYQLYREIGQKRTIASLAYNMIILSSNLATNLLIELVNPENVMKTMKAIGAMDIKVLRGVEDGKAFQKGLNNTTTAADLMLIYELMARKKLVSKKASTEMVKILLDQKFNEIIPAQLPADVKVAHKTGSITGLQHNSGVIYLPNGEKYVLVLLSRFKPSDEKKVVSAMADASRALFDYVNAK